MQNGSVLHLNQQADIKHTLIDIAQEMIPVTDPAISGHASGEIIASLQCNNKVIPV